MGFAPDVFPLPWDLALPSLHFTVPHSSRGGVGMGNELVVSAIPQ